MFKLIRKIWYHLFPSLLKIDKLVPDLKNVDAATIKKEIRPGDIVIAAMNIPLNQLLNKDADHRLRPYIIAQIDKDKIYGYCGSSQLNRRSRNSFYLSTEEYSVWKNGSIMLERCYYIPDEYIISINDHLKKKDIDKINAIIKRQHRKTLREISVPVKIHEGALVENKGRLYYIFELSKPAKLFNLTSQKAPVKVSYNNKTYYINPNTAKKVKNLAEYNVVGSLPKSTKKQIRDYQEKTLKKQ
ncbi:MAG: hypothetical protein IKI61_09275 [Erysipelotrichaceae bacterium]|jgi:hypothetical protein|nr:hypothetical protein [Erysipelotrichaceae bacterium]MCR5096977.1 hypothetical protein [Erysipelotrichaceae bacterium]